MALFNTLQKKYLQYSLSPALEISVHFSEMRQTCDFQNGKLDKYKQCPHAAKKIVIMNKQVLKKIYSNTG